MIDWARWWPLASIGDDAFGTSLCDRGCHVVALRLNPARG
jgi:hypothetical protein